jgi:hypothetical protein
MNISPDIGVLALPWKSTHRGEKHVRMLAVIIRAEVFERLRFVADGRCCCVQLMEQVKSMGLSYECFEIAKCICEINTQG